MFCPAYAVGHSCVTISGRRAVSPSGPQASDSRRMARRKLYDQFHQPSHILRYYHIEMECFVYNWRILLGGAASAAILTAGVGAPAFAQAQDTPVSLSGLNSASGVLSRRG